MSEFDYEAPPEGGWVDENWADPGTLNDEPAVSGDESRAEAVPSGFDYRENPHVKVADVVGEQQAAQDAWARGELPPGFWRSPDGVVYDEQSWKAHVDELGQMAQQAQAAQTVEEQRQFFELRGWLAGQDPQTLRRLAEWSAGVDQQNAERQRQAPLLDRLEAIAQQGHETQQAEQHAAAVEEAAHEGLRFLLEAGVPDAELEDVFNFAEEAAREMVRAGWPESRATAMHALALAALDNQGVEFRTNRGGQTVPHSKPFDAGDLERRGGHPRVGESAPSAVKVAQDRGWFS